MPPRICMRSLVDGLNASLAASSRAPARTFSSTVPIHAASRKQKRTAHLDRYAVAQLERKRLANRARKEELRAQEAREAGDPVHGRPTPFVESFDTALDPADPAEAAGADRGPGDIPRPARLKHFLQPEEIERTLEKARHLSRPINPATASASADVDADADPAGAAFAATIARHRDQHRTAAEAIARITSLAQGSASDRRRVNIQRCIDAFGRHRTDAVLPRRPLAAPPAAVDAATPALPADAGRRDPAPVPRGGPDTGSSEVQIAILTAKIRAVAIALETRGRTDRVTKRDLRLLVHRRQKLLQYLRRKERGGPRWTNVIEKLGLTEATWRGEISL